MSTSWGRRALASAIGLALASTAAASPDAPAALNDTAARAHLETMEKTGVLSEPVWAHAYWARSASAPTLEARIADLRWALRFDPDLGPARWDLCLTLLRTGDPEFATQCVQALSRAVRSFAAQQRAAAWAFTTLVGALALGLLSMAAILIGSTVPPLHHGVREKLHFLPREMRAGAAWLTILVPFVLVLTLAPTSALFWTLLIGTAGAWSSLEPWRRRVCVAALTVVVLSPTALAIWTRIMEPAFPTSYLRNLWATQKVGGEILPAGWWTAAPEGVADDAEYLASLALLERRAGRYGEAATHLERAIALRPEEWSFQNNLGNVHLLRGDSGAALATYARALQIAPEEGLIWVNVAQAHVQRLEFNEADQALSRANALGYRLPPVLSDESEGIIVRDHALSSTQLWTRFLRGEGLDNTLEWRRVVDMTLAPLFPMRPFWLSLPLLFTLWYAVQTRSLPRVFPCSSCGRPVCRKCHYRSLRRSLCADCFAIRTAVTAPMKRDAMMATRRADTGRARRLATALLSALLPGAGLMLLGSYRRATWLLAGGSLFLSVAIANATWPAPSLSSVARPWLVTVVLPLLLFGLFAVVSVRSYLAAPPPRPVEGASKAPELPVMPRVKRVI